MDTFDKMKAPWILNEPINEPMYYKEKYDIMKGEELYRKYGI